MRGDQDDPAHSHGLLVVGGSIREAFQNIIFLLGRDCQVQAAALSCNVNKLDAQQHLAGQKLEPDQKRSYTLVIGMRNWFFAAFRDLMRK